MATRANIKSNIFTIVETLTNRKPEEHKTLGSGSSANAMGLDSTSIEGMTGTINEMIKTKRNLAGKSKKKYFQFSTFKATTTLQQVIDATLAKVNA